MALNFKTSNPEVTTSVNNETNEVVEVQEVEQFDIVERRSQIEVDLMNSPEIEELTAEINISDPNTIVTFGGNVAEEMSKCADGVLNGMTMSQINDSGVLLGTLAKIMEKFDINEIKEEESKNIFNKLFNNAKKQLEKILEKYHTMGEEIEKINVQLKKYEVEINESNKTLQKMFETNVLTYQKLVKYIVAGERGVKEIDEYLVSLNEQFNKTGDNTIQLDINNLENAKIMLEQRTQDLRIAENVAMQSIPMIKTMQFSNLNLIRKINSAFIITLPIFKQALTQAILLKRQRVQAEAMAALDQKTNEMLINNARNTVNQSKMTAQLAGTSSVKIETLEETWRTICNGIEETKAIQADNRKKREEDARRLEALKQDYNSKMNK